MAIDPHIIIVQDNNIRNKSYINLIKHYHNVKMVDLYSVSYDDIINSVLIIVQVDLNDPNIISPLKEFMTRSERLPIPALFLMHEFSRREIVQANTLGAADYIIYPCPDDDFIQIMENLINKPHKKSWSLLSETQKTALEVSLKVVEKTFHNAFKGLEVSQNDVKNSCNLIIEATAKEGLTNWMKVIREHHDNTYRHSMVVCGYLISFGMLLDVSKSDLRKLAVSGMIHDIGKAKIPLAILDKPSELNPEELKIFNYHPHQGRLILQKDNWDDDMIDVTAHHHEHLDGSGYPDGLSGAEISDLTRMVSIANIFSDLTDKRSFRPVMPADKAIETMLDMKGILDIPLVHSFRAVVLAEMEEDVL
ncbi:MAG: HD domain-containing protein [Emcibacter sp.]|nr:HD domain-containing protein [Emcibacter sp.]